MNKKLVIQEIIGALERELEVYLKAAQAAHAEATHEQSKAENKYDTRGLEAAYLARGQSRQAATIRNAIELYQKLPTADLPPGSLVDVGALVELKEKGKKAQFYFIGPSGGGTEVVCDDKEITVITPQSPLGSQLIEHKEGEKVKIGLGNALTSHEIVRLT